MVRVMFLWTVVVHTAVMCFAIRCRLNLNVYLLVPYRWNRGDYRFPRRLSVCPSVCLSVSQSTRCPSTQFSELFSVVLWDIDLKFGIWICLHIIQIKFDFGAFDLLLHELLPFAKILFSGLFFVIFRYIELKFHIWICLDIIQVKFDFGCVWPTFTWGIALCKNFVFRTFLCHLST